MTYLAHKVAAKNVLQAIRSNPSITAQEILAIMDGLFPSHGQEYIEHYINWWYDCGIVTAATLNALKARIALMDDTQFNLAYKRMAWIAMMGVQRTLERLILEQQVVEAQEGIQSYEPKTVPDQEALDFWNSHNDTARHNSILELEIIRMQAEIERLQED